MRAEIICVGTELLLGDILNTNAQFLSRELSELGIIMYNQQVVGDNAARLAQAVNIAKQRCDIVILSGGLGPTDDDLTKQTLAQIYNDELVYSTTVEKDIQGYFARINVPMTENNKRQAFIPKNGKYIKNENGTAPGMIFIDGEKLAILLPGPPKELMPMMKNDVEPLLKKLVMGVIKSRYIKTTGIGESTLETKVSDILAIPNPSAALYASVGEVTIRLTARTQTEKEADTAIKAQMLALDKRISDYIYGVDVENLETVIVETLKKTLKTVATAESCTGGLIASRITSVAGASKVFELGICAYSNKQKLEMLCIKQDTLDTYSAVSPEVAAHMAQNVRTIADSDYGVATTGYTGPTGENVGLIYVAVATKEKTYVARHNFTGSRETVTKLASQYALDLLRRVMFNLPQVFAVEFKRDRPKAKKSPIKNIIAGVVLLALAAGLAFGYMWLKEDDRWRHLPIISDILNTQTVATVIGERQEQNFFSAGFERETAKLLSGSWAQNLNLKGWITIKKDKKEYAIGTKEQADESKDTVVYEDVPIGGIKNLTGFSENGLYKTEELASIEDGEGLMIFDTENSYSQYSFFSVAKFSAEAVSSLKEKTDIQEVIDTAKQASVVEFSGQPAPSDEIVIISQSMDDGSTAMYFAKKNGESIKVDITNKDKDKDKDKDKPQNSDNISDSAAQNSGDGALPQASASPELSPTPSASPSTSPKVSPSPSPTAKPSPSPAKTPKPTPEPTPEPIPEPTPQPPVGGGTLTVTMNGNLVTAPAAEILSKIVSKEMTGTWNAEALKAQAVATHTFIKYQHASGNSAPAVSGRDIPFESVVNAVNQVADKIMTIGGSPVYTPYFASSAGRTNSAAEVWGSNYSHLQSVESKHDKKATGFTGTVRFSKDDMAQVIRDIIGVEPTGDPSTWITVLDKTSGGYNGNMSICGATTYQNRALGKTTNITGRWMREDILKVGGTMVMRSASFDITYDGATFIFTTYGYGHGAGMSQWGAQLYAQEDGWSYDQILTHYYTGVTIQST